MYDFSMDNIQSYQHAHYLEMAYWHMHTLLDGCFNVDHSLLDGGYNANSASCFLEC